MPEGSLEGCWGGRALEAAMGVSRRTKIRHVAKFKKHGWVIELARGITLNRRSYASLYGIPARRKTPCQVGTTGTSVKVARARQDGTRIGITQSENLSITQHRIQVPTPSGVGVASNRRVGRWPLITEAMLRDDQELLNLHRWYATRQYVPDGEQGMQIIFEAAENALANATSNPPGMFVRRIRDCKQHELFPVAEEVCDRANQRLKQARGHSSVDGYGKMMRQINEKRRQLAARSEDE